jgi:N-acetylglucosamine-6-phosphate deacetylase
MDQAVSNLKEWTTASAEQARACASVNPGRLIGLDPAGGER